MQPPGFFCAAEHDSHLGNVSSHRGRAMAEPESSERALTASFSGKDTTLPRDHTKAEPKTTVRVLALLFQCLALLWRQRRRLMR